MSGRKRYESDICAIREIDSIDSDSIIMNGTPLQKGMVCELCKAPSESKFIILNCGHLFHVQCIVQQQLKDVYKYQVLDESYFVNTKCTTCDLTIDKEDLLIIHTKYMSSTENTLSVFSSHLQDLEFDLDKLKKCLRSVMSDKHALEQTREKSKYIIAMLESL